MRESRQRARSIGCNHRMSPAQRVEAALYQPRRGEEEKVCLGPAGSNRREGVAGYGMGGSLQRAQQVGEIRFIRDSAVDEARARQAGAAK